MPTFKIYSYSLSSRSAFQGSISNISNINLSDGITGPTGSAGPYRFRWKTRTYWIRWTTRSYRSYWFKW